MKQIVIGYDGTLAAEHALTRAAELAKAFGSSVVVVSVAPRQALPSVGAFGLTPYRYLSDPTEDRIDQRLLDAHRDRVQAFFATVGVPVSFTGVVGDPVDEILAAAAEHDADLIVVGTREPGVIERLLGGSVSQGVARRAHRDVLIVHAPDPRD